MLKCCIATNVEHTVKILKYFSISVLKHDIVLSMLNVDRIFMQVGQKKT